MHWNSVFGRKFGLFECTLHSNAVYVHISPVQPCLDAHFAVWKSALLECLETKRNPPARIPNQFGICTLTVCTFINIISKTIGVLEFRKGSVHKLPNAVVGLCIAEDGRSTIPKIYST